MKDLMNLPQAYLDLSLQLPVDDTSVRRRLDRAYELLQSYGYTVTLVCSDPVGYTIYRASTSLMEDNSVTYLVDTLSCTCPDYDHARGNLCKHRLAVMLLEAMKSKE